MRRGHPVRQIKKKKKAKSQVLKIKTTQRKKQKSLSQKHTLQKPSGKQSGNYPKLQIPVQFLGHYQALNERRSRAEILLKQPSLALVDKVDGVVGVTKSNK